MYVVCMLYVCIYIVITRIDEFAMLEIITDLLISKTIGPLELHEIDSIQCSQYKEQLHTCIIETNIIQT